MDEPKPFQDEADLSIIIPCYNEEKNIALLLKSFSDTFIKENAVKFELVLCDNGSNDKTGLIIDQEINKNKYKFINKIKIDKNLGYGNGIYTGLKQSNGRFMAYMHADLQTEPQEVLNAYNLHRKYNDEKIIIKGRRKGRRSTTEKFLTSILGIMTFLICGLRLFDANAQPKLFHKSLLKYLPDPPNDFAFDIYLLAMAKASGYKIIEFDVSLKERLHGDSKGGSGSNLKTKLPIIKSYLKYLFILRKKCNA